VGVALPELPDDRRAQPRRYDPAEPPGSARHAASPQPEGPRVAGRPFPSTPWPINGHDVNGVAPVHPRDLTSPSGRHAPAPPSTPTNGRHADGSAPGGRHSGGSGADVEPTNGAVPGRRSNGGRHAGQGDDTTGRRLPFEPASDGPQPNGRSGRVEAPTPDAADTAAIPSVPPIRGTGARGPAPTGAVPHEGELPARNSRDLNGPAQNGAVQNGAVPNGAVKNGAVPNGAARNGHGPAVPPVPAPNGSAGPGFVPRDAAVQEPSRTSAVFGDPPAVDGGPSLTGAFPAPAQRLPDPDDQPTVVHGRVVGVTEPDEAPGRHRRRAGESPDGRPAASYQSPSSRKAKPGRRRRPAFWKELPLLVVVALLLTFLIQTFLAKVYVIPSGSMETTLHGCTGCNNDRVLVDKVTYRFSEPRPGDVVVFRGPDSWNSEFVADPPSNVVVQALQTLGSLVGLAPPDEKDFVKRVIAVGGQTVQCCDSRNRVVVDGQPLDEPYIYYLPEAGQARQDVFSPVRVPEGQLWMMGDSRNNSADSRVPGHGPVPVENVIGKARLVVLPFSRFGTIPDPNPQSTALGLAAPGGTAPLALSLVGAVPLLLGRRRLDRMELHEFLPRTRRRRR
jgi:signal peptidase I